VACGGEEAGLGKIGLLGQHLRLRQLLVDAGELRRAASHALLQRFVGALQREVRRHLRRDVGIGGHHAAVRHRRRAQLQDAAAGLQLQLPRPVEAGQPVQQRHLAAGGDVAALGQVAQDAVERHAHLAHLVREGKQRAVLAVQQISRKSLSRR